MNNSCGEPILQSSAVKLSPKCMTVSVGFGLPGIEARVETIQPLFERKVARPPIGD